MKYLALPFLVVTCLAAHADERAIVKEMVVKATPEVTFRTWTTSEGITSFFAPEAQVDPRPEGAFHIHFNPYAPPGLKGADDMRFLAVQPPQFFSFTWNAPPHLPEARRQRTVVTVRLAPAGEGQTRVTLRHSGWGDGGEWDKPSITSTAPGKRAPEPAQALRDGPRGLGAVPRDPQATEAPKAPAK
jgi:uncharacterized protein YndB with AHSA1/START domain